MSAIVIRPAEEHDLPALLAIYNHYILNTAITFDLEPKTLDERKMWFKNFARTGRHQCLITTRGDEVLGWAASMRMNDRAAYDTSVAVSVYLLPQEHRKGFGRTLYETLFAALKTEDIHRLYGAITHPNPPSVGLHLAMGFRCIGVQTEVGRKFGKYWDVGLYERAL